MEMIGCGAVGLCIQYYIPETLCDPGLGEFELLG